MPFVEGSDSGIKLINRSAEEKQRESFKNAEE